MNILNNLTGREGLTNIILCGIILIYAVKAFKDLIPTRSLAKELDNYWAILSLLKTQKNDFSDLSLDKIYEDYKVSLSTQNFRYLNENIEDYNRSLESKNLENVKCDEFFNEISVIDKNFNLHCLNQKGPTLVGLGVLGTFIGLFFSLNQLGVGSGTTEQLNIIDKIIPGMSLAFLTSLLGMAVSLFYTRCQKTWIGSSIKRITQIQYDLGIIFPRDNTSDLVLKIEKNLKLLSENLTKDLGNSVATAIDETKGALFGTFEKSMNKNMNKMTDDISSMVSKGIGQIFNKELVDDFKEIQNSLIETRDSIVSNNEIFVTIVKDLPKVVTKFKTMSDITSSIFENSQKSMQEYDRYMKGTENFLISMEKMSQLQNQIGESVHNLGIIIRNSYGSLEESTNRNSETINKTVINLANQHKGINTDLKESLIQMLDKNNELLSLMNVLVDKSSSNLLQLDSTMNNSVKLITNGMEDRRKDFEAQHIKISKNQEKLENEIGKALNEYDKTVSNVTGQIKDIILNLKDMVVSKND